MYVKLLLVCYLNELFTLIITIIGLLLSKSIVKLGRPKSVDIGRYYWYELMWCDMIWWVHIILWQNNTWKWFIKYYNVILTFIRKYVNFRKVHAVNVSWLKVSPSFHVGWWHIWRRRGGLILWFKWIPCD